MPKLKQYPAGVTDTEKSPFFHLPEMPWMLFPSMVRQFVVAELVFKYRDRKATSLSILDVGCGYAEQYVLCKSHDFRSGLKIEYVGVDLDEGKRSSVLARYPNIDYRIHDITHIEKMGLGHYDFAIMADSLEHVTRKDGLHILASLVNLATYLVLAVPTPDRSLHRDNPHHLHEWELPELQAAATSVGWEILDNFWLGVPCTKWKNPDVKSRLPNIISGPTMGILSDKPGSTICMVLKSKRSVT